MCILYGVRYTGSTKSLEAHRKTTDLSVKQDKWELRIFPKMWTTR